MMSTEGFSFSPSKRKDILQHTVDNEVSALARLTIYENLLIGQETSVRIKRVSVRRGLTVFVILVLTFVSAY